jgi:hypothetical protein
VLAYVFWHRPAGPDSEAYETRLAAFHRALDRESAALRRPEVPWLAGEGAGYEDWYLVADWTALGELNAAAVSWERAGPHDAVAALAGAGVAGVYAPVAGPDDPALPWAAWLAKPAGVAYPEWHAELARAGAAVWQRQMTLGPAPEYCVRAEAPVDLGREAVALPGRVVFP